jgi:hypothetical protein
MNKRRAVNLGLALLSFLILPSREGATAAPSQLYGKSIIVSWTSDSVIRNVGEQEFSSRKHPNVRNYYISSKGRPFVRDTFKQKKREIVDASGTSDTGGPRAIHFQGNSLVDTEAYIRGARRIQIDFDDSFGSCTAHVIAGKEPSASTFITKGIGGKLNELRSRTYSDVTCAIKDGNVLAD